MASNKTTEYSSQEILNRSYDKATSVLSVELLDFDGTSINQRTISKNVAVKVTTSGSITYVAKAPVGSLQASSVWQVKKIDSTTGVIVTWANGNSSFNNVATDLTILTYS